MLGEIFDRFVKASPVTVMTRGLPGRLLNPGQLDAWFERTAERRYTRELRRRQGRRRLTNTLHWGQRSRPPVQAVVGEQVGDIPLSKSAENMRLDPFAPFALLCPLCLVLVSAESTSHDGGITSKQ